MLDDPSWPVHVYTRPVVYPDGVEGSVSGVEVRLLPALAFCMGAYGAAHRDVLCIFLGGVLLFSATSVWPISGGPSVPLYRRYS